MRGAPLVLTLLLVGACGSRTDLGSLGESGGSAPVGGGGNGGAVGTGGIGVGGGVVTGTGATGGSGGAGTGGVGTGGTTTGTGGVGTGGTTAGAGGTGGTTTGAGGGTSTGTGGMTTGTGGTGGIGTGGAGKGGGGAGGTGGSGGKGGASPDGGTNCWVPIQAEYAAMDLYFLIDKSASMATVDPPNVVTETRWERTASAVHRFALQMGQPFRVGVGFFPLFASDSGIAPSCASGDYATPSVPMHFSAQSSRVASALAVQTLRGESPTGPAFDGALAYMLRWAASPPPPDELVSRTPPTVVLMTDGAPTACGSTVDGLAAAAAAAFRGTPRIRTFVLAIGSEARGLDPIAAAGGSHRAFASGPRDFEEAFDKIARTRIICDIPLGEAILGSPDLERIEIRSRLMSSAPFTGNRRVVNAESCGTEGGWFFEPPARPTMILICPSSCAALIDAPAGEVQARVPCSNAPPESTPAR